jgi:cold shock protein
LTASPPIAPLLIKPAGVMLFFTGADILLRPAKNSCFYSSEVYMQGTIKKVVRDRGFGFIHADDGREFFFHRSSLQRLNFEDLREGDAVEFDVEQSEKGPRAANVRAQLK